MIKLIKLELKKNNFRPYIYAVLGIFLFTLSIGVLFASIPKIDPNDSSSNVFSEQKFLVTMISVISMSSFAVLCAVMHTKFIVNEYTNPYSILIFSYPYKRSTILLSKYFIIFVFTFSMMIISNIASIFFIEFICKLSNIISISLININILPVTVIFSFIANLIGLISLRIGFWKKSVITTIITSVILISPIGNSVVLLSDNLFIILLPIIILLIVLNIILCFGLIKKVNTMECI